MKRWQAAVLGGIVLVLLSVYAAGWYVLANRLAAMLPFIPQQLAQYGITVNGEFSGVKGFPLMPEVDFTGKISGPTGSLAVPLLEARGLPLPGQTLTIKMPQGAQLESANPGFDSELWSVKDLTVTAIVPPQMPSQATTETLRAWRDGGGKIDVRNFTVRKETLKIEGRGVLVLDNALQPAGQFDVDIRGYGGFLDYLKHKGLVKKKQTFIIQAILSAFAKQDIMTGEKYLSTALNLKDNHLSLGPLEIFTMPPVSWPSAPTAPASPE